jgi:hypothetical protein
MPRANRYGRIDRQGIGAEEEEEEGCRCNGSPEPWLPELVHLTTPVLAAAAELGHAGDRSWGIPSTGTAPSSLLDHTTPTVAVGSQDSTDKQG